MKMHQSAFETQLPYLIQITAVGKRQIYFQVHIWKHLAIFNKQVEHSAA